MLSARFSPYVSRTTYSGLARASSYIRPTYRPTIPITASWIPLRNVMAQSSDAYPGTRFSPASLSEIATMP